MKKIALYSLLLLTGACAKENATPTPVKAQASSNVIKDGYNCPDVYDPVCANGVTYPNSCYASKAGVTVFTKGSCDGDGSVY